MKFKDNDYQVSSVCCFFSHRLCSSLLQFSKEFTQTAKQMPMLLELWTTHEWTFSSFTKPTLENRGKNWHSDKELHRWGFRGQRAAWIGQANDGESEAALLVPSIVHRNTNTCPESIAPESEALFYRQDRCYKY